MRASFAASRWDDVSGNKGDDDDNKATTDMTSAVHPCFTEARSVAAYWGSRGNIASDRPKSVRRRESSIASRSQSVRKAEPTNGQCQASLILMQKNTPDSRSGLSMNGIVSRSWPITFSCRYTDVRLLRRTSGSADAIIELNASSV